MAATTKGDE